MSLKQFPTKITLFTLGDLVLICSDISKITDKPQDYSQAQYNADRTPLSLYYIQNVMILFWF